MAPLVLGLDVGGSKTHAVLADGDTVLAEVFAASANPSSVGMVEAGRQLDAIFAQLPAVGPVDAVCAGAAGVDTVVGEERFQLLLRERAPSARVAVVHDATLILAAAGTETGIAVISGTGSVGWGRDSSGRTTRVGGWGYLLGDEGGGYWVARAAVVHALTRADDGKPDDLLSSRLVAACGLAGARQLLDHFYAQPERRYWAGLARVVFDLSAQHDQPSAAIVDSAAAALASLATRVGAALDITGPVVLAGGLAVNQPELQGSVQRRLRAQGLTDVRVLDRDPVHGAVELARALLATPEREAPHPLSPSTTSQES